MLVDIHGHIGQPPLAAPAARVASYAGTCQIDLVLVSNRDTASQPAGAPDRDECDANAACLMACRTQPRLAPLYRVRVGRADSSVRAFAGALATEPFLGAVFAPAETDFDAAASALDPYFDVLASAARPALVCYNSNPCAAPSKIYQLARRFPQQPIIMCMTSRGEAQRGAALDVVRLALREGDASLFLDTSHATAAEVCASVDSLGPERVLFGTDALSGGDAHIPRQIALLAELRNSLNSKAVALVTGGNAVRLFGLGAGTERRSGV
jgi:predicted TIM-barrel fold metal-dependent hydrolase